MSQKVLVGSEYRRGRVRRVASAQVWRVLMSGYLRWQRIIATLTMTCVAIAAMMATQVHATAPNATQWQSAYATCSSVNVSSGQDITTTLRNDLGGGGCWQLPSGTFYLNGPVDVAPGNTLQGNGMGNTM